MRSVILIDTSVLCNLLKVPFMCERHEEVRRQLEVFKNENVVLTIPLAAVVETGNHVAHQGDGDQRRKSAGRFKEFILRAVRGQQPFELLNVDKSRLDVLLEGYPDYAMRKVGLGDQTILDAFAEVRERLPTHRVRIWSFDSDLAGYDTHP